MSFKTFMRIDRVQYIQMIQVAIGLLVIIASVILSEHLGKNNILNKESSRKIPHVVSSLAIASVALFIDIRLMEILLLLDAFAILIIYKLNLFSFARAVDRLSWGELFFPIGLIASAFIAPNRWIFVASVLVLGLSDAIAALVGSKIGKHKYKMFGHVKSIEGSLAFLVTTVAILGLIVFIAPSGISTDWITILFISACATIIEGIAPWGVDNLLLPILIATALSLL